ncbi:MAG: NAD(P)H-binding protein [Erythrobacter sp.]|uniref:NAD(P)H-binding protein n=1 Tax=Erythrobacter sp. TaxID=1042 RepID=UPI00262C5A0F|nr:NAD(P)H-binding protein [Erythrobacter sp.]MDJ0979218.1 NAD(P)H-binding protein [Erythrobacter sp.]
MSTGENQPPSKTPRRICVAGASGTIGRAVVRESVARGYEVTALVRTEAAARLPEFIGATVRVVDVSQQMDVSLALAAITPDAVISCLASRSGSPKDARDVDLDANMHLLIASESQAVSRFILLSAICVQRPRLAFQKAKLEFEAALKGSPISHTIVRPTAFFKSLSGQVKRVAAGKPFLIFGDGELTRCKPISDGDLARFIVNTLTDPAARGAQLPIGGPGPAISLKQQGAMLFELAGQEPRFKSVPVWLFDVAARVLSVGAPLSDWFAEKAEYARIARYYATESMLLWDERAGQYDAEATPEFGTERLRDHYAQLLAGETCAGPAPASV